MVAARAIRERRAAERGRVYRFLALAFSYPDAALEGLLREEAGRASASLAALEDAESAAAVSTFAAALASLGAEELLEEHRRCFGHTISKECPPYEAEYGQAHIFQKSDTLADVAGFYRAFGLEPSPGAHERLDHIATELEFMEHLCCREAYALGKGYGDHRLAVCIEAERKFLAEHLATWIPDFTARLKRKAPEGVFSALAAALDHFIASELQAMGVSAREEHRADQAADPMPVEPGACDACPLAGS